MAALDAGSSDDFDQLNAELGLISPPRTQHIELRNGRNGVRSPLQQLPALLNDEMVEGLEVLREVRVATEEWISSIGPIDEWPRLFQEGFDAVYGQQNERTTQEGLDDYLTAVANHAWEGHAILHKLRASSVVRPPASHKV